MDLAASIQQVTEEIMLAHGPARAPADRHEEPLPGRRRGAELRRQRPDPARRARSRTSGFSRPPATPAGRSARRCSSGTSCSATRALPQPPTASRARSWARTTREARDPRRFSTRHGASYRHVPRRRTRCATTWPSCWPTERSSAGFRDGWSSARGAGRAQHPGRRPQSARCSR